MKLRLCLLLVMVAFWSCPSRVLRGQDEIAAPNESKKCAQCGNPCVVCKVCVPKVETKKHSESVFECECEDFCIPGRSTLCGREKSCDECGELRITRVWQPGCGTVRSKRVLKKSTEDSEQLAYSWEVQYLCVDCCGGCVRSQSPTGGRGWPAWFRKSSEPSRCDGAPETACDLGVGLSPNPVAPNPSSTLLESDSLNPQSAESSFDSPSPHLPGPAATNYRFSDR